jgi:hypothetical protein
LLFFQVPDDRIAFPQPHVSHGVILSFGSTNWATKSPLLASGTKAGLFDIYRPYQQTQQLTPLLLQAEHVVYFTDEFSQSLLIIVARALESPVHHHEQLPSQLEYDDSDTRGDGGRHKRGHQVELEVENAVQEHQDQPEAQDADNGHGEPGRPPTQDELDIHQFVPDHGKAQNKGIDQLAKWLVGSSFPQGTSVNGTIATRTLIASSIATIWL